MNKLLALYLMITMFNSVGAQTNVFSTNEFGSNKKQFMILESSKVYATNEFGSNKKQIMLIDGGKVY
ncbi:MAG: hypothetical protein RLZZ68_1614, partial [Bacteroidota bacterium]